MAERYSKLYSIETNLYTNNSPVIIEAGSLLKDNKTGEILGQLKFLNITNNKIISLIIILDTYDISDNYLEEIEYTYMDLNASRDDSFGAKIPITFNNSNIRKFTPYVKKVIFEDKSIVEFSKVEWKQLPNQIPLCKEFDEKYIEAYKNTFSSSADFFPLSTNEMWFCSCGKINNVNENICHYCNQTKNSCHIEKGDLKMQLTYVLAENLTKVGTRESLVEALEYLKQISLYGEANKLIEKCNSTIEKIDKENDEKRIADEIQKKKTKRNKLIITVVLLAVALFAIIRFCANSIKANKIKSQLNDVAFYNEEGDGYRFVGGLVNEFTDYRSLLGDKYDYKVSVPFFGGKPKITGMYELTINFNANGDIISVEDWRGNTYIDKY